MSWVSVVLVERSGRIPPLMLIRMTKHWMLVASLALVSFGCDDTWPSHDAGSDGDIDGDSDSDVDSDSDSDVDSDSDIDSDSDVDSDSDSDDSPHRFVLALVEHVALPFATVGEVLEDGALALSNEGGAASTEPLDIRVTGDFAVEGDRGPLLPGTRELVVRYTGPADEPSITRGEVTISADGQTRTATLAAVIGHADLPETDWTTSPYGTRSVEPYPSAPFPHVGAPWTDSSVLVVVPEAFTDQGDIAIVTHLHGHGATLEETIAAQSLVELHALSGRDALFVAPQGPVEAASGNFGRLDEPGGLQRLVRDVVTVLYRDGLVERPFIGDSVITSHSGGYRATANIIEVGGLDVIAAHLYDSLYAREATYRDFVIGGGVLRSNYTASGGTADNNATLTSMLEDLSVDVGTVFLDDALLEDDVTIGPTGSSHGNCMWRERTAARWLVASGLRRSPLAPPEILYVKSDGVDAEVRWREDRGATGMTHVVQGSSGGARWEDLVETTDLQVVVPAYEWMRVVARDDRFGDSASSDRYAGLGGEWLIVDGFDRVLGGSWSEGTHDFAASLGVALGEASTASNEAIVEGLVDLRDYERVLWMLGDESRADLTFDDSERELIERYLDSGGELIVSGSEVGYATNASWFSSVLHASYVSDDAGTNRAGGYTFGVIYEEDYPDVLTGDEVIWAYDGSGAAAVGWNGQVVVVGFPLETIGDENRSSAIRELMEWLSD